MILQGVGQISCLGLCYANDPKKGGYTTPAPALDLTTSLQGDFSAFGANPFPQNLKLEKDGFENFGGGLEKGGGGVWNSNRLPPLLHTKFTPRAVASPDAPQKPLVRKRACSAGAKWVKVTQDAPVRKAKKPCTTVSQQPACTHKEHQILTSAEAASFASQFWDCKVHTMNASQHEFLATCIDVNLALHSVDYYSGLTDNEPQWTPMESQALWKGTTMRTIRIRNNQRSPVHCSVPCIVEFPAVCSKI